MGMQRAIFHAWKRCRSTQSETPHVAPWLALIDQQTAQHWKALTDLSHEVRARVRADDKAYYEQIAANTAAVAADEGVPGLWKAIKAILPKQRSKMKHSIRACGPDPQEISQHFQALEAGNEAPYESLLSKCQEAQQESGNEIPLVVPLHDIPSRIDMEQVIMKQKARKAPGLDGVKSETLRKAACDDSMPFFQLILKAWTLGAEPIQFKGGLIHCIAKKSGSLEAHKMRGIMLLDSFAKTFHALVRQSLLKWMTHGDCHVNWEDSQPNRRCMPLNSCVQLHVFTKGMDYPVGFCLLTCVQHFTAFCEKWPLVDNQSFRNP